MKAESIRDIVIDALLDLKGQTIKTLDVRDITPFMDYMIVVTGSSNRHVSSLATHVVEILKKHHVTVNTEGTREGEWVLVDAGSVVVHIMQHTTREYYALEKLWAHMPSEHAEVISA